MARPAVMKRAVAASVSRAGADGRMARVPRAWPRLPRPAKISIRGMSNGRLRRVGKATGSRECAPDDRLRVPTNSANDTNKMVGTAQTRLCPPYDSPNLSLVAVDDG